MMGLELASDLRSELQKFRKGGSIWITSYSIHNDIYASLFSEFYDKFKFYLTIDGGGVVPTSTQSYGQDLKQICNSTLHSKLILITPHKAEKRLSTLYVFTGNIRDSMVTHINHSVKLRIDEKTTRNIIRWIKDVRKDDNIKHRAFLIEIDTDGMTLNAERTSCLGKSVISSINGNIGTTISNIALLAPWGGQKTIDAFFDEFPVLKALTVYAGRYNYDSTRKKSLWSHMIHHPRGAEKLVLRRATQKGGHLRHPQFVHSKAGFFQGLNKGRRISFLYIGSGNFTRDGFWGKNIELGILFKGSGKNSTEIVKHFKNYLIGEGWTKPELIPVVEQTKHFLGKGYEDKEPFPEDGQLYDKSEFEKRKAVKALLLSFERSQKLRKELSEIFEDGYYTKKREKKFQDLLNVQLKGGISVSNVDLNNIQVVERSENMTSLSFSITTTKCHDLFLVVHIEKELPYSEEEKVEMLDELLTFDVDSGHHGWRRNGKRDKAEKEEAQRLAEKLVNVRFPYRKVYSAREQMLGTDGNNIRFKRYLKNKISLVEKLKGSSNTPAPLWWKSILAELLKDESVG
jgi:hypothetical protein